MSGIFMMFSINTVVTNHFEMLVGNVNDESFDELDSVNGFRNQQIVFMSVVVESNVLSVIVVYTGGSDDRSAEVSANILDNVFAFGY